jgi:hypothetical protein
MLNGAFEKLLVAAVEDSFSSLGESPKQAIFFHLENTFKIKGQEILSKLASFDEALRNFFGSEAGLETLIVKKLCEKPGSFDEAIVSIKRVLVT